MQRRTFACLISFAVVVGVAVRASAQTTLMTGLGGPRGYGTSCMPPNDDGSWPADTTGLDLTPAFPTGLHFYTGTYTRGWINNNGSLSFGSAISTYTPSAFPGATQPMIAPYWADVDTRDPATTCSDFNYPSGGGYPAGAGCMNPTSNGVWWSLTPGQMVITWDQVGFYACNTVSPVTSQPMSFQMILTSAAGCGGTTSGMDFDVEFRYAQCGWTTGDASGGTSGFCTDPTSVGVTCWPAQAGFDSGPSAPEVYQSLPGSLTSNIATNLCTMSNLTPVDPGVWRFGVRGGMIMCPMAGQPCNTPLLGICMHGQLQCTGTSMTTCQPFVTPQPTQCNGLDNDCDGVIDTGPCPAGYVCDGAQCVPMCVEGACFPGQTCTSAGLCEDTACMGVTCTVAGQRCVNGMCQDACSGVTCPIGQICRLGSCVDPCSGLTCGTGQVCSAGMCIPTCPCTMCSSTQTCGADGRCVDMACATVTCGSGQVCQGGSCVDACTGAVCPNGQMCVGGMCTTNPNADAGPGSDGGPLRDGGPGGRDGGNSDARADGGRLPTRSGSCGCRTAGSHRDPNSWIAIAFGLGLAALSRRRRA